MIARQRENVLFGELLRALQEDVRRAGRRLFRRAGTSALLVATIGIGVGAVTAAYAILDGVLLQPFAYPGLDRLVSIAQISRVSAASASAVTVPASYATYSAWRAGSRSLADLAAFTAGQPVLTGAGDPVRANVFSVTANLFAILGVRPLVGHAFSPANDAIGTARIAILSYGVWASQFGRDPHVVGHVIFLDGKPYDVIGVMPASFRFPVPESNLQSGEATVWRPIGIQLAESGQTLGDWDYWIIGRLKNGATMAALRKRLDVALAGVPFHDAPPGGWVTHVVALRNAVTGDYRIPVLLGMGGALVVLLVACASVSELLLAQGIERSRVVTIYFALGASKARLVQQLLAEAALIALLGALLGAAVALLGLRGIALLAHGQLPRANSIGIHIHTVVFLAALSTAASLLFGLGPAVIGAHRLSLNLLRSPHDISSLRLGPTRVGEMLVVLELSFALALVTAGVMMGRGFVALERADPGFDPSHVLVAHLRLAVPRYPNIAQVAAFASRIIDATKRLPGVVDVAVSTGIPLAPTEFGHAAPLGQAPSPNAASVHFTGVTPGYFAVLRIALHRGQLFQRNISPAGKVALVNGVLARELFGNMEALGRQITFKGDTASIVGVVADTREFSLDVPSPPHVYIPLSNERMPLGLPAYFLKVVVRSQGAPGQLAAPLRTILRRLDPAMPVDKLMPMSDMVGESTAAQRVTTTLVAILAALALVIATAGAYAVISRGAIRRERELAIRIALGARQRDLVSLVIGRAACLLGIGAVLGGGTAVATTKILQHVVVGVSANSVFVIGSVATVLIGVGLVASWQPVKRALRADPAAIIRFE